MELGSIETSSILVTIVIGILVISLVYNLVCNHSRIRRLKLKIINNENNIKWLTSEKLSLLKSNSELGMLADTAFKKNMALVDTIEQATVIIKDLTKKVERVNKTVKSYKDFNSPLEDIYKGDKEDYSKWKGEDNG